MNWELITVGKHAVEDFLANNPTSVSYTLHERLLQILEGPKEAYATKSKAFVTDILEAIFNPRNTAPYLFLLAEVEKTFDFEENSKNYLSLLGYILSEVHNHCMLSDCYENRVQLQIVAFQGGLCLVPMKEFERNMLQFQTDIANEVSKYTSKYKVYLHGRTFIQATKEN